MVAVVALITTLKDYREEEGWRPEQCQMQKKQGEIWLTRGVGFEDVKNKLIHQSVIGRANVMGKGQKTMITSCLGTAITEHYKMSSRLL